MRVNNKALKEIYPHPSLYIEFEIAYTVQMCREIHEFNILKVYTERMGRDKLAIYSSDFQLPIKMMDEGDSSNQDLQNGNTEAEEVQEVEVTVPLDGAQQDVTLQIKLHFPEGVTLNDKAPNKWKVESHSEYYMFICISVILNLSL